MGLIKTICLDVDGVLVDFVQGAAKASGIDWGWLQRRYEESLGEYDLAPVFGISNDAIWRNINALGSWFWESLPHYPWCDELIAECHRQADRVVFCTTPGLDASGATGKLRWLQKVMGTHFRDYLIGPPKHVCARPGSVLIDDSDDNCAKFVEAGGQAIVFPRPWNSAHAERHAPMLAVRRQLAEKNSDQPRTACLAAPR